ncbi:hypothetical protein IJT93_06970 [bacterium]|nr:hypothetical protein [bacterium]
MNNRFSVLALTAAILLGGALTPVSVSAEETGSAAQPILLARDDRSDFADRIADYLNLSKEQRKRSETLFNDFDSRMFRLGSDNDRYYDGILNSEQRENLRRNKNITLTPEQIKAFERRRYDYDRSSDSEFDSFKNRIRPMLNEEQRRRLNSVNYSDWRSRYGSDYSHFGRSSYTNGKYDYNDLREYYQNRETYSDGIPRTQGGVVGRTRFHRSEFTENGNSDSYYDRYDDRNYRDSDRYDRYRDRYDRDRDRYDRNRDRYDRDRDGYDRDKKKRYEREKERYERDKERLEKDKERYEKDKERFEKDKERYEKNKERYEKDKNRYTRNRDIRRSEDHRVRTGSDRYGNKNTGDLKDRKKSYNLKPESSRRRSASDINNKHNAVKSKLRKHSDKKDD